MWENDSDWSFLALLPMVMDGLGEVGRNSIYLKMAIKKICLSQRKMAVSDAGCWCVWWSRIADHTLQTDTAALMWLKIVGSIRPWWSKRLITCGLMECRFIPWLKIISIWFLPKKWNQTFLPLSGLGEYFGNTNLLLGLSGISVHYW